MNSLYRKRILPSGRVRYEKTCEWDTGDPAEGLWVVRRGGQSRTWITDKVADMPPHANIVWVSVQVDVIADAICKRQRESACSCMDLALAVINALMEADRG